MIVIASGVVAPARAAAQSADGWQVSFVPLYFWVASLDGRLAAGPVEAPIALDFADAVDNLGGAFSLHLEVSKGRWGVMTDLNFIRLESSADFAVGPMRDVAGDFELNNVMFEAAAIYRMHQAKRFDVIGGLRTYTLGPKIDLTGSLGGGATFDDSRTSANAFVGFAFRPRLSSSWSVISRADIGAGDADLTWSLVGGLEYRFKPWGGIDFGYKALGIDVTGDNIAEYDVTHHGPIFGLRFYGGQN